MSVDGDIPSLLSICLIFCGKQSENIKLDPELSEACRMDVTKYCDHVSKDGALVCSLFILYLYLRVMLSVIKTYGQGQ